MRTRREALRVLRRVSPQGDQAEVDYLRTRTPPDTLSMTARDRGQQLAQARLRAKKSAGADACQNRQRRAARALARRKSMERPTRFPDAGMAGRPHTLNGAPVCVPVACDTPAGRERGPASLNVHQTASGSASPGLAQWSAAPTYAPRAQHTESRITLASQRACICRWQRSSSPVVVRRAALKVKSGNAGRSTCGGREAGMRRHPPLRQLPRSSRRGQQVTKTAAAVSQLRQQYGRSAPPRARCRARSHRILAPRRRIRRILPCPLCAREGQGW